MTPLIPQDLTSYQDEALDFLKESWKKVKQTRPTVILLHGPSACGKTEVAEFLVDYVVNEVDHEKIIQVINWSALNDGNLKGSLLDSLSGDLYSGTRSIEDALANLNATSVEAQEKATREPRALFKDRPRRFLIVINDIELALQSPTQRSFLFKEVLEPLKGSDRKILLVLTSINEPLGEEFATLTEPSALAVREGVSELLKSVDHSRHFDFPSMWEVVERLDLVEAGLQSVSGSVLSQFRTSKIPFTCLGLGLLRRLKQDNSWPDTRLVNKLKDLADKFEGGIARNETKAGETHVGCFIRVLHSSLYEEFAKKQRDAYDGPLRNLLAWASVDPGFDLWSDKTSAELKIDDDSLAHLNQFFFRDNDKLRHAPRLAHRSVLSLYSENWPYGRGSQANKDRRQGHLACMTALKEMPTERLTREHRDRIRIASLRHEMRSSPKRGWEMLNALSSQHFDLPGSATHELAYARDDFRHAWLTSSGSAKSSLANFWYQPPTGLNDDAEADHSGNLSLLRFTSEVMYWDMAYQALDDWDATLEQSRILYKNLAESLDNSTQRQALLDSVAVSQRPGLENQPTRSEAYWNALSLCAGLYGTMVYEIGKKVEPSSVHDGIEDPAFSEDMKQLRQTFKAAVSANVSRSYLKVLPKDRHSFKERNHLYLNLLSNQFVAEIKSRPSQIPLFTVGEFDSELDRIYGEYADFIEHLRDEVSTHDYDMDLESEIRLYRANVLDTARYRLNFARLIFLSGKKRREDTCSTEPNGGASLAAQYLYEDVLSIENEEWYTASQEWMYAYIQRLYFRLYANEPVEDDQDEYVNSDLFKNNGDTWARYQLETVLVWQEFARARNADRASTKLEDLAIKFAMDPKAQIACNVAVELIKPGEVCLKHGFHQWLIEHLNHEEVNRPNFCEEDLFYRASLALPRGLSRSNEFIQRWFADTWYKTPPIMPGMLILRGIPMSFSPCVQ